MKNKNKGFFLAETIVVLSLVTTIVVFVSANVPNLYKNYKLQIESYDQIEDIYLLKAIYEANKGAINDATSVTCPGASGEPPAPGQKNYDKNNNMDKLTSSLTYPSDYLDSLNNFKGEIYLTGYLTDPSSTDYNFNKYLKRLKKTSAHKTDYRLIAVLNNGTKTTYASIKIDNPNPIRSCNLGVD